MKEKNKLLQVGSILMIVASIVSIIVLILSLPQMNALFDFVNTVGITDSSTLEQMAELNMTQEQAVSITLAMVYVIVGIMIVFQVVKLIVGILGLKKADQASKFFTVWGIIFLVFGVLGLSDFLSITGVCNLAGGIVAPILFIVGAKQNKKNS